MPQEVKHRIYEFTLGGQLIHLLQNTANNTHSHEEDIPLSHRTCRAILTEAEAQANQDNANPFEQVSISDDDDELEDVWNVDANQDRHVDCYPDTKQSKDVRRRHQLNLSLLRVCRQIFNEAKGMQYAKNTFVFNCSFVMERFIRYRVQCNQHLLIRSIFMDIGLDHPATLKGWATVINKFVLKKLRDLTSLHVGLEQTFCECWIRDCVYSKVENVDLYRKIERLGKLNLKEVTVVVCDDHLLEDRRDIGGWAGIEQLYRWTLAEKQAFAREMRKVLLAKKENVKEEATTDEAVKKEVEKKEDEET